MLFYLIRRQRLYKNDTLIYFNVNYLWMKVNKLKGFTFTSGTKYFLSTY